MNVFSYDRIMSEAAILAAARVLDVGDWQLCLIPALWGDRSDRLFFLGDDGDFVALWPERKHEALGVVRGAMGMGMFLFDYTLRVVGMGLLLCGLFPAEMGGTFRDRALG